MTNRLSPDNEMLTELNDNETNMNMVIARPSVTSTQDDESGLGLDGSSRRRRADSFW